MKLTEIPTSHRHRRSHWGRRHLMVLMVPILYVSFTQPARYLSTAVTFCAKNYNVDPLNYNDSIL